MITIEEYEKAVNICLEYKNQIIQEIKSIKNEDKKLIDMYYSGEIPVRFYKSVCLHLGSFVDYLDKDNHKDYRLSDLFNLEPKNVLRFRNSGTKNLEYLLSLRDKYNI